MILKYRKLQENKEKEYILNNLNLKFHHMLLNILIKNITFKYKINYNHNNNQSKFI